MNTDAIYRERAKNLVAQAEFHDAMAVQSGYGDAESHRMVADGYRVLAQRLLKLALRIGGGAE